MARPRLNPGLRFPPSDPGSRCPLVLRMEVCDRAAFFLPDQRTFCQSPPAMEQAASQVVSCLSLGVCKEKHNKDFCPQGRLRLRVFLPKLWWCHKPISRSVLILLCGHGAFPPSLGLCVPV